MFIDLNSAFKNVFSHVSPPWYAWFSGTCEGRCFRARGRNGPCSCSQYCSYGTCCGDLNEKCPEVKGTVQFSLGVTFWYVPTLQYTWEHSKKDWSFKYMGCPVRQNGPPEDIYNYVKYKGLPTMCKSAQSKSECYTQYLTGITE